MRTGKSSVLYFNVKYARTLGGEYQRSVFSQVGYRYSWQLRVYLIWGSAFADMGACSHGISVP